MLMCFSTLSFCVQNQQKIIPEDMKRTTYAFWIIHYCQLLLQGVKSLKKGSNFTDPDLEKVSIYTV